MKERNQHISAEELSAFVDSDLEAGRKTAVAAHIESCAECKNEVEALMGLKSGLANLASAEPSRDLWPAVQRAAAEKPQSALASWLKRFWMVPTASLAGAAAALLVVMLVSGTPQPGPEEPKGKMSALASVQKAEVDYRNAIAALEGEFHSESPDWSPEVKQVVVDSLAEIDRSIEKCRVAMGENPDDREAQEAILTAYQHKVDFLTELVAESM
jgi:hypothetical protein